MKYLRLSNAGLQVGRVLLRFEFNVHDLWIGIYWKTCWDGGVKMLNLWVCAVPTVPLFVNIQCSRHWYS